MYFSKDDIDAMPSRFRAHFVNSLSGYKSANLVGTTDGKGQHNLAIVSSVVHLGAQPPLVALVMRPDVVERHTLANIRATRWYTLNQVHSHFWQAAHQTSAKYSRDQSEFDEVGLEPEVIGECPAPFVKESHLKYAVKLVSEQPIEHNGTILLIGSIEYGEVLDDALCEDGHIDLGTMQTIAITGLDGYHIGSRLGRLSYAQPHVWPSPIDE
ncbi:flavin reductase family protein [Pseudoalteromonas sp. SSDWG2]|uniref:flavin reductase family protein n=1 Tax=Pseudoalteromonas sp. SSDWG2 TaxID=3139391 RepID=UPI003BA9D315